MTCDNLEKNLEHCTCSYTNCSYQGKCCECIQKHMGRGEMVGCYFSMISPKAEKTYDRSLEKFKKALDGYYN